MSTVQSNLHQPVEILRHPNTASEPFVLRFKTLLWILSWSALLLAGLIIVLGLASLTASIKIALHTPVGFGGSSICGGILLGVIASIGIASVEREHRCLLISFSVLAILAAVICGIIFAMGIYWAVATDNAYNFSRYYYYLPWYQKEFRSIINIQVAIACFSAVYAATAIVVSSLLCVGLCSCCKKSTARRYIDMTNVPTAHGDEAHAVETHTGQAGTSASFSASGRSDAPPSYDEVLNLKSKY